MEGILYALVPMVAWGSIGFVSNKIGGSANQQTFGMTLGALLFSTGVFLVVRPSMTIPLFLGGMLGGFLWSIGQNGQFHAMKYMGVSVANPLSSGAQLLLGSLIGVLVFSEWTTRFQFTLGFIALAFLLAGIYFASKRDQVSQVPSGQFTDFSRGIRALIYSTLGYISYAVLFNNILKLDPLSAVFPMSLGMVFGALMFMGFKVDVTPVVLKNAVVGIIWGIGNIFMLLAAKTAGLAIAFSFSQLGMIISIIGGILFLGETKTKKEIRWTIFGIICFVIGAVLLSIVKSA